MRYLYLLLIAFPAFGFDYRVINAQELKKKSQKPCVFIHFWASWCEVCIRELPELLNRLEGAKGFESVVVDLSAELAQKQFSEPWLKKNAPKSSTYRRGKNSDSALITTLKKDWDESLPLSLLFVSGTSKMVWEGAVKANEITSAVQKFCKASGTRF